MDGIDKAVERVLVVKSQMGERPALEELYRRYNPRVGYYLRRMIQTEDAADAQQEVWLTVLRRLPRLRAADAFSVWLYRIARSKALDRIADRRAFQWLETTETEAAAAPEPPFMAADAAAVHVGIARLPPPQREVVLLRFMEDLSYEQIADVVGCTIGTVRSRLHHAKHRLAHELEDDHE